MQVRDHVSGQLRAGGPELYHSVQPMIWYAIHRLGYTEEEIGQEVSPPGSSDRMDICLYQGPDHRVSAMQAIIEAKAPGELDPGKACCQRHVEQLRRYMEQTGCPVGVLYDSERIEIWHAGRGTTRLLERIPRRDEAPSRVPEVSGPHNAQAPYLPGAAWPVALS